MWVFITIYRECHFWPHETFQDLAHIYESTWKPSAESLQTKVIKSKIFGMCILSLHIIRWDFNQTVSTNQHILCECVCASDTQTQAHTFHWVSYPSWFISSSSLTVQISFFFLLLIGLIRPYCFSYWCLVFYWEEWQTERETENERERERDQVMIPPSSGQGI